MFTKKWECDVGCGCNSITFRWINEKEKMIWWKVPRCGSSIINLTIDHKIWTQLTVDNVDEVVYQDYFNFAVSANPWRRVASCFWLFNNYHGRIRQGEKLSTNVPFPQFVDNMFTEGYRNHHWYPVSCYVPPEDAPFDFTIIPLEDLTEEWNKLAKEYNQPTLADRSRARIPSANNPKPWGGYYKDCPDVIDVVAEHYKEDIKRFNHQF